MAITNYTELQTAMTNWLSRTNDTNLQSLYPDCITLAEAKFNRMFRVNDMIQYETLTTVSGQANFPAGMLSLRTLYLGDNVPVELEYITPEQFYLKYPIAPNNTNVSRYYTIDGPYILLSRRNSNDESLNITFYQRIEPLSSSDTNWLLEKHPDMYLYAALAEVYDIIKNGEMAAKFADKALWVADRIIEDDKTNKYSGSTMRVIAA
jgi:hypothetical protein